jgi:hypothetical protein
MIMARSAARRGVVQAARKLVVDRVVARRAWLTEDVVRLHVARVRWPIEVPAVDPSAVLLRATIAAATAMSVVLAVARPAAAQVRAVPSALLLDVAVDCRCRSGLYEKNASSRSGCCARARQVATLARPH